MPIQVGSSLSVYTELFGWIFYGMVWDALVASGIIFLPFFVIVAQHLKESREANSSLSHSSDSILSGLEVKILVLALVLGFAGIPSINVTANSFAHSIPASSFRATAALSTNAANNTTFDGAGVMQSPVPSVNAVEIPPLWYGVSQISHGLTYVVQSLVDDRGKAITAMKRAMELAHINDPVIGAHLNRFYNECYIEARRKYFDNIQQSANVATAPTASHTGENVSSIMSPLFVTDAQYYSTLRTRRPVPGVNHDPAFDVSSDRGRASGSTTCLNYLNLITDEVRKTDQFQASAGFLDRASGYIPDFFDTVNNSADARLVRNFIDNAQVSYVADEDIAVNRRNSNDNAVVGFVSDAIGLAKMASVAIGADVFVDALIYAMHQTRALLLMIVILALPIGFVVSMYSPGFLLQASILYFAITFVAAIWSIASWAESTMAMSMFPSANELSTYFDQGTNMLAIKKRLALSGTSLLFYTVVPLGFFWVLSAAGSHVAGRAGAGFGAGAIPSGGVGARAVGSAAARAGGRVIGKGK